MEKIHLEGMGVLGCILALHLEANKIPFTWNDTGTTQVAWRACTGAVYPGGSQEDLLGGNGFVKMAGLWPAEIREACVEVADYWFNHKKPPHKGTYPITAKSLQDVLKRGDNRSWHLNAQKFVPMVRERFTAYQTQSCPLWAHRKIVTHGFSNRFAGAYWGWTVPVKLAFHTSILEQPVQAGLQKPLRPCIYLRKGKFVMVYAYPIAGTEYWYSGSSLIWQKKMRSLEIEPKFERWCGQLTELSGGQITVTDRLPGIEGWRPAPAKDDKYGVIMDGSDIVMRPLWNSGVRHSAIYVQQVMEALCL